MTPYTILRLYFTAIPRYLVHNMNTGEWLILTADEVAQETGAN